MRAKNVSLTPTLEITVHEMRSVVNEDIGKSVKWGIKSLSGMPISRFCVVKRVHSGKR
ncbi:MAG: hypothetical protein RBR63_08940 [Methanosarcina vacuolata]|jgi:hypothetical protein|nr:hypothetical protein [Methanosarcina vacuolata]